MDNEKKYWLILWGMGIAGICVIATIIAITHYSTNSKIENLIRNGTDPIAANCALSQSSVETCRLFVIQQDRR